MDKKSEGWKTNFLKLGGLHHLLNTFIELDIKRIDNALTMKCIDNLIQLIYGFIEAEDKQIILSELLSKK